MLESTDLYPHSSGTRKCAIFLLAENSSQRALLNKAAATTKVKEINLFSVMVIDKG